MSVAVAALDEPCHLCLALLPHMSLHTGAACKLVG
jgi:hypothetical protein